MQAVLACTDSDLAAEIAGLLRQAATGVGAALEASVSQLGTQLPSKSPHHYVKPPVGSSPVPGRYRDTQPRFLDWARDELLPRLREL